MESSHRKTWEKKDMTISQVLSSFKRDMRQKKEKDQQIWLNKYLCRLKEENITKSKANNNLGRYMQKQKSLILIVLKKKQWKIFA